MRLETDLSRNRISMATGELETPLAARVALSTGDAWKGMRLDRVTLPPADERDGWLPHHAVVFHLQAVDIETAWPGERSRVVKAQPGSLSVIPARFAYRARWTEPCEMVVVRLAASGPHSLMPDLSHGLLRMAMGTTDQLLRDLLLALLEEARESAPDAAYASALGSAMAAHLVRRYGTKGLSQKGGLPGRRVQALVEYVEAHLGGALSLANLAERAGMSVRHFARAFKESMGLTPHEFVRLRRIERAKALLASSDLPVRAVAEACGFRSQSRFTSAFRKLTKSTPARYRATAR